MDLNPWGTAKRERERAERAEKKVERLEESLAEKNARLLGSPEKKDPRVSKSGY